MIEEIDIRDLGVIARATLPLGPGFTAITGETGAGKTMVVTALGLLLGERSDSGVVRSGAKQASTQGRWLVASAGPVAERVREAGGELDDIDDGRAELLLGRSVSAEGRSRATVGGQGAPVGVLAEVGAQLVVVHGQSEQIRLKSVAAQRQALDRYAGAELHTVLEEYRHVYRRLNANRQELDLIVDVVEFAACFSHAFGNGSRGCHEPPPLRAGLFRPRPHDTAVGPLSEQQPECRDDHGLACAGLTGDGREPGPERQCRPRDDSEVTDVNFFDHVRPAPAIRSREVRIC